MSEALVTASAVSHSFGDRSIFEDIHLTVHRGDRIALVGPNGSGKSTLLRLLAGLQQPTGGTIRRVRGLRLAWLPQVVGTGLAEAGTDPATRTVREELEVRTGVAAVRRKMDRETERLADGDLSRIEAQGEAVEQWTRLGGPDLDGRIGRALVEVGLDPTAAELPLSTLSGGQLARVNLASLHLARLDVALLDEPGNHLDAEGLEMLCDLLPRVAPAVILASHDRSLLGTFAQDVVELKNGSAHCYSGGWDAYRREEEAARERAVLQWLEASREKRRLVSMERRIREQAEVGERRARRPGETDKFIRHMAIESSQKNTAASGISKRIDSLHVPEKPWQESLSTLLLEAGQQVHTPRVAVTRQLVAARGQWQSQPIDLSLAPGERVLLTGPNGSGKSSLVQILAGRLEPASGSVEIPSSVRIIELAQQGSAFAGGQGSLADRFRRLSGLDETRTRTSLAAMKLGPEKVERPPSSLSPGELTRAELALIARTGAACLLLDEPSNHLDIEALEVLEEALKGWPGALIVASHDQAFRQSLDFDRELDLGHNQPL